MNSESNNPRKEHMTKYIICDLEATGNRKEDRIIQMGLIIYGADLDTKPLYIFDEMNFVDIQMMPEAMEVHNITAEMIEGKKLFLSTKAYKKLQDLNSPDNVFIAHDAHSDLALLAKEGFDNKMHVIDTLKCTKHLFNTLSIYRLQYLRYRLELYKDEGNEANKLDVDIKAHDAISDALICKLLFQLLLTKVEEKYNLSSKSDMINKLIELSSEPVLLSRFAFGKYKGEVIKEVAYNDYNYLQWMRETLTLDEDMKYTLDYFL